MSNARPVFTPFGIIFGRDAIYLDAFSQEHGRLIFAGELNGNLCQGGTKRGVWIGYRLTFFGVLAYDCRELEICKWQTPSQFDEADDSEWLRSLDLSKRADELNHEREGQRPREYILSTYDWVYRIAASRFVLDVLSERPKPPPGKRGRSS